MLFLYSGISVKRTPFMRGSRSTENGVFLSFYEKTRSPPYCCAVLLDHRVKRFLSVLYKGPLYRDSYFDTQLSILPIKLVYIY